MTLMAVLLRKMMQAALIMESNAAIYIETNSQIVFSIAPETIIGCLNVLNEKSRNSLVAYAFISNRSSNV